MLCGQMPPVFSSCLNKCHQTFFKSPMDKCHQISSQAQLIEMPAALDRTTSNYMDKCHISLSQSNQVPWTNATSAFSDLITHCGYTTFLHSPISSNTPWTNATWFLIKPVNKWHLGVSQTPWSTATAHFLQAMWTNATLYFSSSF